MFWLEENEIKQGTPSSTTCGRLTVTFAFFCFFLLVYLKSDFYLLQYIITTGDIIIKQQTIVLASNSSFLLLNWLIFTSMFHHNLQLAILAHDRQN